MKKTMVQAFKQMLFNGRTLLLFEFIYRIIGIFIIYPIARLIFYYSISASGYTYVINAQFISYLTKPLTLFLIFMLILLFSVYILVEFIFLALLYDLGYHKQNISFSNFVLLGFKRVLLAFRKYHIFILVPAFSLVFLVQIMNFVGIASTVQIPSYIVNQINQNQLFSIIIYGFIFLMIVIFIESLFSIHLFSIDQYSLKSAYYQSRKMLKGNRLKMLLEFGVVNLFLNLILYLFYFLIIAFIAGFIWITRGQEVILGYLLSVLYSVYLIVGLFATIILIPVNFSLITTWYYQYKEKNGLVRPDALLVRMNKVNFNSKWFRRGFVVLIILFSILNITTIVAVVQPESQFELLNKTEIVAHRGSSMYAPENTLASIELAINQGADVVEFDVRLTKDGIPVLMHDDTIKRTTNVTSGIRVQDMTLEELKEVSAGSWFSTDYLFEPVPTLEEAIALIDHQINIFIDLKANNETLEQKVIEMIEENDMLDITTFLSTNRSQLQRIKAMNSDHQTLLLLSSYFGNPDTLINFIEVDAYGLERSYIQGNPGLLDLIHLKGKKAYVWTVNDPAQLESLIFSDIDGIITDDPIVAIEITNTEHTQDLYVDLLKKLFNRS